MDSVAALTDNNCFDLDILCLGPDTNTHRAINDQDDVERGRQTRRPSSERRINKKLDGIIDRLAEETESHNDRRRSNSRGSRGSSRASGGSKGSKKLKHLGSNKASTNNSSSNNKPANKPLFPHIGRSWSGRKQDDDTDAAQVPEDDEENQKSKSATKDGDYATDAETDLEDASGIQAHVIMISGCEDAQTSADVSNVANFELPDPNGKAGGACTSALLQVLYNQKDGAINTDLSFIQVLRKMRGVLMEGHYSQIPQLTSSRPLDTNQTFYIVPPDCTGTRRAVLIGINYTGQSGELSGCQNDCNNMKDYIVNVWGFQEENIVILMDDGIHTSPTRANILKAYKQIAATSQSGDAVFCHYSGHGGRVRDDDVWTAEEKDGYDETLVPVDYKSAGQIRDDDLYTNLVCAMPKGVTLVSLMDCCHSATVLDLPYQYRSSSNTAGNSTTVAESTKCLICSDPQFPMILLTMAFVFCIIFFPIMYA